MITSGSIKTINNIGNYDNVSYIIDLSKLECDIKKDTDKIIISLTKKESKRLFFNTKK